MKSEAVVQGVDENDPVVSPSTTPIPAKAVDRCEDACLTITNRLKPPRISRSVEGLLTSAKSSLCDEDVVGMPRALGAVHLTLGKCPPRSSIFAVFVVRWLMQAITVAALHNLPDFS